MLNKRKRYVFNEASLQYEEVRKGLLTGSAKFGAVILIIILIIKTPAGSQGSSSLAKVMGLSDTVYVSRSSKQLSMENVARKIAEERPKYGDICFAQAVCESDRMRSPLAKRANNLTGMKVPGDRPTRVARELSKDGWAHFYSWEECVEDLRLWQLHVAGKHLQDRNEYLGFLDGVYEGSGMDYQGRLRELLGDPEVKRLVEKYGLDKF
jgi:hypothetical protein